MTDKRDLAKKEEGGLKLWDPFQDFREIRNSMMELVDRPMASEFARLLGKNGNGHPAWAPKVDIEEKETEYLVTAELPGVEKDHVKVEVKNGGLRLCGEKKSETETKTKNMIRQEQFYGKFERYFALPEDIKAEEVKAVYKNGILKVHIPRSESAKPKTIEVKAE